jgi:hypothetical protein
MLLKGFLIWRAGYCLGSYFEDEVELCSQSFKSSSDILFFSSTYKHFLIKFLVGDEMFSESLNLTGILVILSMSYFSVLHSHGVSPCSISNAIIPIDQMSFLIE